MITIIDCKIINRKLCQISRILPEILGNNRYDIEPLLRLYSTGLAHKTAGDTYRLSSQTFTSVFYHVEDTRKHITR
jgi:hypothetical protein